MDNEIKDMLNIIINKLGEHDKRFNEIDEKIEENSSNIKNIKLTLENDIEKKISIVADGYHLLFNKMEKVNQIADDIDDMRGSLAAIEAITAKNWSSIVELRRAK